MSVSYYFENSSVTCPCPYFLVTSYIDKFSEVAMPMISGKEGIQPLIIQASPKEALDVLNKTKVSKSLVTFIVCN